MESIGHILFNANWGLAFFANPSFFGTDSIVADAGSFFAGGAKNHKIVAPYGSFNFDDAAGILFRLTFEVAFVFIDTFDDDFIFGGENFGNFTLFTFIFTGDDLNLVVDVKFHVIKPPVLVRQFWRSQRL